VREGGVGDHARAPAASAPMTIATLLANTVLAAERMAGLA
jgi:5,10-methylene-tetrahydrofolate dehydrogenase/methenyl tetrahydrofolate cyclohydrolase